MRAEQEAAVRQEPITGGGEMGVLIRSHDWFQTRLGPSETWSHSLKTALSILLNACSPMFLIWGRDRILFYNDAYSSILGESSHRVPLGQPVNEAWAQEWDSVRSDVEQVFATGQPFRRENQRIPINGNGNSGGNCYTWSYSAIWDETGQVEGVFATGCRVISEETTNARTSNTLNYQNLQHIEETLQRREEEATQRKLAEAELQRREREFRAVVENTPDLIIRYDRELRHLYVNPSLERALGIPPEQFIAKTAIEMGFTDATSQAWTAALQPVFVSGQDTTFEFEFPNPEGERRSYQAHFVPELVQDGEVNTVLAVVRDVTEYKRAEEALRQSEQRYRLALQAARMVTWAWDARTDSIVRSETACDVMGLSPEALQGTGSQGRLLVHPDDLAQHQATVQAAIASRGSYISEFRMIRPDNGTLIWIEERGKVNVDAMGHLISIEGTLFDISDAYRQATQRKLAEESLRQSEERLRLAMEGAQMATWDVDLTTGKAVWSEQHFTMLGYEPLAMGEATEEMWSSRIHPDDRQRVVQAWHQSREEHKLYQAEYRVIRADNQQIAWLAGLGHFTYDQSGQAIRSIGVLFDISERKQAEEALRQSQENLRIANERFELAAAAVNCLIYDWNLERNTVERTEGLTRILGYSLAEAEPTPQWWRERVHPEDLQRLLQEAAITLKTSDHQSYEYRIRNKDNQYIYVLDQGLVVNRDKCGNPTRIVGSTTDINDRKQAEKALRQSEERYRYLTESIPQLVWTANAEGVLLDVNQRWLDFTGLTLAQAQIEGWQAIVHPDDLPVLSQHWAAAQHDGTYYQAEGRIRRADGVYRWHLHQAVPLKNEQGQVRKWFGTATEIDDQKQLEQQRDRILQQEQAAREEAERANRIKDEFLAVLSHELRSPLNPILGWVKLLQARKLDERTTQRALETIERNAKLQTQLIEDLLDVSRILRGKMVLNVRSVNLVTVIQAAIETVGLAAEAKQIAIQTVFTSGVEQVSGDAARLQQIVWNLLTNAVKFTPAGGRVDVRLDRMGTQAQIQVKDTGKGIKPEFLPHVFEYFRQEDGTTTRQFGGLGLGLAIVRHLSELHGGTVHVDSPGEGLGATFTVRIPLLTSASELPKDTNSNTDAINLSGVRILVVDDEADMRDLAKFLLEQYGAEVNVVASALEALTVFDQFNPDVLISDIGMPTMDGYMLMREVRKRSPEQGGNIPAIALTAYAGEVDQRQALAVGFQQHVAKPVEPEELVKAVATLIR